MAIALANSAADAEEIRAGAYVVGQPAKVEVYPASFELNGSRRYMHLVVTGHYGEGLVRDLTRAATFEPMDPRVIRLEANVALPKEDGKTAVWVRVAGHEIRVPVEVKTAGRAERLSFVYDTLAALTKQGCNAGACHGSPTGKGGFRMSLRGFDPELDQATLVRDEFARRTNPLRPESSLLLRKPLMQVAHGGGQRLRTEDPAYLAIRGWIGEGCRPDPQGSPVCEKIEVYPRERVLRWPAHSQQFIALGRFSDGSIRDVTRLTVFASSDEAVAKVDAQGHVVAGERGETAILVRYLEQIDVARLTYLKDVPGFVWSDPPENNYVDRLVFKKLRELQIPTSELCTDSEFIRRLHLDVLGMLPESERVKAFLADADPGKRAKLIDEVLSRPERADFWALKWGDLLRVKSSKITTAGVHKFHRWLLTAVGGNMPYDQFARELLTARGSTFENPPANYFRTSLNTNDCTETTSQLFLGIRIQCAKCHNHPGERWTQDNYYGIGAFFNRVDRQDAGLRGDMRLSLGHAGEVVQPRTGKFVKPWLPLTGDVEIANDADRREVFAGWLVQPKNPFFAAVGVNRIWGHVMGRGIVEPVDDFRDSNPPSNQELLAALSADFARDFDQRRILRTILASRTYQLSSRTGDLNRKDEKYFSHSKARLLSAEQLLDALSHATGVPEKFAGLPAGMRATQLPSPDVGNDFLKVFGQPARETACECERASESSLSRALQMINGELIAQKVRNRNSRLSLLLNDTPARLLAAGKPPQAGLVLWLRAEDGVENRGTGPAKDGDEVSTWRDQPPVVARSPDRVTRAVTQSDSSRRPKFVADAIAGLPGLRFDGKDDLLHHTSDNLVASGGARTVLVVGRAAEAGQGGTLFSFRRSTAGGTTVFTAAHMRFGDRHYVYSDGINSDGNSVVPSATADAVRQPFLLTYVSPGAGEKLAVWLNGAPLGVTQPGGIGPDNGAAGFTVGNREDYSPAGWNGDLSEILVYDRPLPSEELTAAGSYLAVKYELTTPYPPPPSPVAKLVAGKTDRAIISELYLTSICRYPTESELAAAMDYVSATGERRRGLEDVCWALLNSKEFLFQH